MEEGHVFTIEPIIMLKPSDNIKTWNDGWTVVAPGIPSAQWEHMILITKDGREILTERSDDTENDFINSL